MFSSDRTQLEVQRIWIRRADVDFVVPCEVYYVAHLLCAQMNIDGA